TARVPLCGHSKSSGPGNEEGDEPADDEEVREPDLVELAVVPEPRDEDKGQEKQEGAPDREGAKASVHRLTRSPVRLRTGRSRTAACGRRCPGSRSAS